MKKIWAIIVVLHVLTYTGHAQTIRLSDKMLMHEMRATPYPLNGAEIKNRKLAFMWPLLDHGETDSGLDGIESERKNKLNPNKVNYKLRISMDSTFSRSVKQVDCNWALYNADEIYDEGVWYWQYGYVEDNKVDWSRILRFTVKNDGPVFAPPTFAKVLSKVSSSHPRVWVQADDWDQFIQRSASKDERSWYLEKANKVSKVKIQHISETIDTSKVAELDNEVKRNALLVRESRRIVDREESNTEVLIRAYLLTKDRKYADAAMQRLEEIMSWNESPLLKGDFNESTLLSLCSMAYDSFYNLLSTKQKQLLLAEIEEIGTKFFNRFHNHFEAHIADNHSVQMNLRIFTMAAFATIGDLKQARQWADYAYNVWVVRFPGVNNDGGWHNGDSYFHVNIRTLIEVPYFYTKLTGYDFFADPWYKGNAMYVIYQQPPFSKSAGNGSSHQKVLKPSGTRVAYADALARLTGNTYLSDYVDVIKKQDQDILKSGFMGKAGDLSWFRLDNDQPRPIGRGLQDLPLGYVFRNTGIATFTSGWKDLPHNAMMTFRSSPYGSTSHAIANQNAFNTFYDGKPLFYSSGHHISFTDEHSVYSHRSSRAHNTILIDGMGQKIGTEGYGWIPRSYIGDNVSYILGDASNAYGEVESPLWLERGKVSGLAYTPENGWDENKLNTFRRHIVQLGGADLLFVYDELEADRPVTWDYQLHSIANPMEVEQTKQYVSIRATNESSISEAFLFAPEKLKLEQTDQFFVPATNWLRADDQGNFAPNPNHWHFKASSSKQKSYRYITIISTHATAAISPRPKRIADNKIQVGDWLITINKKGEEAVGFAVENKKQNVSVVYDKSTFIKEGAKETKLVDILPTLEI